MAYMKEANHIYGSVTGCHVNNIVFVFVYLLSCGQEIIQYKMLYRLTLQRNILQINGKQWKQVSNVTFKASSEFSTPDKDK